MCYIVRMGKRGNRSRGRGRGGNQNKQTSQNKPRQARKKKPAPFDPEKHFLPDAPPQREYEPCGLSGEEIDDIVTAIAHPHTGKPVRFESVIRTLLDQEQEELGEDERLAYIGKGTFGIVRVEKKGGRPELTVRKYFHYEDTHEKHRWRRELAPGISRDYVPDPQPLSDLYTAEELASFPRFDSAGSSVITRGS